jgi:tetratricopeptide (TPR) repeat protein
MSLRDSLAFLDVFEAEALVALGRAEEALELLARFEGGDEISHSALADALSLRIRAYQLTGRMDEARAEVQRFIDSIPDEIDAVVPAMLQSMSDEVAELNRQGQTERARQRASDDLIPLAEALASWISRSSVEPQRRIDLQLQIADAYRLAERHVEAMEVYEQVLREEPNLLQALFGRAETLFGQTRYEEAIADYKRISAAQLESRDTYYWQSELRMLQVLDLVNRNTQQIAPRILRLRAIDPDLGGFQRAFAVLENKYARR